MPLSPTVIRRDDGYEISTDPLAVDAELVHKWLSTDAYWALGRSREVVDRAIANSVNFSVRAPNGTQVAYCRVVTDYATFAYLCDVYVDRSARSLGLGTWLVHSVCGQLAPLDLTMTILATNDAHGLYAKAGFNALGHPERWMRLDSS